MGALPVRPDEYAKENLPETTPVPLRSKNPETGIPIAIGRNQKLARRLAHRLLRSLHYVRILIGDVVLFRRILGEIVDLNVAGSLDSLPLPYTHSLLRMVAAKLPIEIVVDTLAVFVAQDRYDADALDVTGRPYAGKRRGSSHEIPVIGYVITSSSPFNGLGPPGNKGNANTPFIQTPLDAGKRTVRVEELWIMSPFAMRTVIGRKDHQRIFSNAELAYLLQDCPDTGVKQ